MTGFNKYYFHNWPVAYIWRCIHAKLRCDSNRPCGFGYNTPTEPLRDGTKGGTIKMVGKGQEIENEILLKSFN